MYSQGCRKAPTLGMRRNKSSTLKGFGNWRTLSGLIRTRDVFPGLSQSSNAGYETKQELNPERVWHLANPFRVDMNSGCIPRVVAKLQPWAEISERLRRRLKQVSERLRRRVEPS